MITMPLVCVAMTTHLSPSPRVPLWTPEGVTVFRVHRLCAWVTVTAASLLILADHPSPTTTAITGLGTL